MLNIIHNIFRIEELRQRIFFTLAMLLIFRLGAHIPTPGIDGAALATLVVVGLSIVVKIIYLQFKIKAHPLTWNLFKTLVAVGILYLSFQHINWNLSPIVQIVLTSALVSAFYFLIVTQFKLSDDLLRLMKRIGK